MTISQNEYCWNNSCTVGPHSVKRMLWSPGPPLVSALELEVEQEGETGLSAVVADLLRVQSATNVYSLATFDITPDNLHAFHMVIQSLGVTT